MCSVKAIQKKQCLTCGNEYSKKYYESAAVWTERKYCSVPCRKIWTVGISKDDPRLHKFLDSSKSTRFDSRDTLAEQNVNWKGEDASYVAKHMWVKYHFGKPQLCEHCGTTEKRMYHWANISREYKRDRSDWLRLCVPCHKKLDISNPRVTVV